MHIENEWDAQESSDEVMLSINTAVLDYLLLTGYGNLDNQCKDPMDNNKDCRVGQLTTLTREVEKR